MSVTETMGGPVAEQMACMQSGEIFIPSQREEGFLYQTVRGHVEVDGVLTNYTADIPLELKSPEMLAYIGGFCAFKKTMRPIGQATAEQGRANLRVKPVRGSDRSVWKDLTDATGVHVDTIDAVLNDITTNPMLQDTENGSKIEFNFVDLVGHSYGGDPIAQYALEHSDNVRNVVFHKAVALEDPSVFNFPPRLKPFFTQELAPVIRHHDSDFSLSDIVRLGRHALADPFQTIGEMYACVRADNREAITHLGYLGVGIVIITGKKDNLIIPQPARDFAAELAKNSDIVSHYVELETDHLGPQKEPVYEGGAVIDAIEAIEQKKLPHLELVK
jgi:pimeloyl-ACP methyl ester carboxylesterase